MNKKIRNEVQRAREDDEENVRWSTILLTLCTLKKSKLPLGCIYVLPDRHFHNC